MTELVLRNFDKAVLEKLNLSAEAREAFRKLLGERVMRKVEQRTGTGAFGGGNPDAERGIYNEA